jgi:hypothetical protein
MARGDEMKAVTKKLAPPQVVESFILIATGEGADARIVNDLDGGLHSFMCVCGAHSIAECGDELIKDVARKLADREEWSLDESREPFQFTYEFEISQLTVTRLKRDVPQVAKQPAIGIGQILLLHSEFEAVRTDDHMSPHVRKRAATMTEVLDELIERRRADAERQTTPADVEKAYLEAANG